VDENEYKNLQIRTVPTIGIWSRIAEQDLRELERWQSQGWEVFHTVNVRGSFGFTANLVFMLRRPTRARIKET
jgi:hypothetical protein